ncbi:serine hydrolase domain-containing protein [Actinoplanes sp. NPDC051851]|uniref:serine hydrolase domain-containing protein n=1 Tax=Actinoplanes sp. NPDC051851 TaxID=3154753 RepID=UPI0034488142
MKGLPPLNAEALSAALDPLREPDFLQGEVSGALVRIEGSAGRWRGRAGIADLTTRAPVPWDARFRIGSMTKAFTATAMFQLAEAGLVELDAPLRRYLPDLLPEGHPATVRQAMDHTSGIQPVPIDHKNPDWFFVHRYDTFAPEDLVLWTEPPPFTPGEQQVYGNVGYIVAGLVIERVTGRPYADAVRRGVLRRLGLEHTCLPGTAIGIPGPHAHGYERYGTGFVDVTESNPSLQWAAAEIISTTGDLDGFLTGLFGGRLLSPRSLSEMMTVPDIAGAEYSAGLKRLVVGDLILWGKSGDRPGYTSGMGTTPDLARRLIYSVNTLKMGSDLPDIAMDVIMAALT